tara:strand:- start:19889 stop:22327 length:2439 start_codon:yes stop_codon:yes gene_type:complete
MADQTIISAEDLVVTGNLKVSGSQVSTTSTDTEIKDNIITLNKGGTLTASGSGFVIESGGSNAASLVYKTSGWDFGNKNITTSGTISGTISLAADSVDNTMIDFGTTGNQVNTSNIPEQTNLYYQDARARAAISATAGSQAYDSGTGVLTIPGTTDHLTEGSNKFFSNTLADARIANANIGDLANVYNTAPNDGQILKWNNGAGRWEPSSDVTTMSLLTDTTITSASNNEILKYNSATSKWINSNTDNLMSMTQLSDVSTGGIASGNYLAWNGSSFVPTAPAVSIANHTIVRTSPGTITVNTTDPSATTTLATLTLAGVDATATTLITFTMDMSTVNPVNTPLRFYVLKSVEGTAYGWSNTYTWNGSSGNKAGAIHKVETSGYQGNSYTFTIADDTNMGTTGAVEYKIAVARMTAGTVDITTSDVNASAVEYRTNLIDTLNELADVNTAGVSTNQVLQYNGSTWTPANYNLTALTDTTIGSLSTGQILKYNGSAWVNSDTTNLMEINHLSDVDTSGLASGSILKYNGSNWVIASDIDTTTDVVDDTTPQLGGALDVNGNAITGAVVNITTSSNGDINLTPNGNGNVNINADLTVMGTATTMDVQNMAVEDPVILLNKHDTQPANNTSDAGIMVQRGTAENNAAWFWDETSDRWIATTTTSNESATNITVSANADIQAGTVYATATTAQYADLAEIYESDEIYEPGTVVIFGGDKEITACNRLQDSRVAGVVSTNPAYLMNKDSEGVAVALRGKVPCKVEGPVKKGEVLVTNVTKGTACTLTDDSPTPPGFCVIGKSLEDNSDSGIKLVNIVV